MVVICRYHCGVIVVMIQWLWSHGIIGFLVPQSFHTLPLSCALLPQLKSQHPMHCSFQNLRQNIDHFTWKPTTNTSKVTQNICKYRKFLQIFTEEENWPLSRIPPFLMHILSSSTSPVCIEGINTLLDGFYTPDLSDCLNDLSGYWWSLMIPIQMA